MKSYKNKNNEIYAFELDGSQDHLITADMVAITDEEVYAINNPPLTEEQKQNIINNEARSYLASTDWYVIRLQESGEAIPAGVSTARAEARLKVI